MTALHVEAGLILDSREGDSEVVLQDIAAAIDGWFERDEEDGFFEIRGPDCVVRLVAMGVLTTPPRPEPSPEGREGGGGGGGVGPRRRPLIQQPEGVEGDDEEGVVEVEDGLAGGEDVENQMPPARPSPPEGRGDGGVPEFPAYINIAAGAVGPTQGADALTGQPLLGGAIGLIMRLTRDSARHFLGLPGTSNITIPVEAAPTISFGLFRGQHIRPRAEFTLRTRLLSDTDSIRLPDSETNVMGYGMTPGESGHLDVRLLVPAVVRGLRVEATRRGWEVPGPDDFALLEWPSPEDVSFRLSFLVPGSVLATQAAALFTAAERGGGLVGRGATRLPEELARAW